MKKFIYSSFFIFIFLALVGYCSISYILLSGIASNSYKPLITTPDSSKVNYESVTFTPRGENFKLEGWFISASKPTENTIIFVHGIATNRVSNKHTLDISYDLTHEGYNVLMFDLRNQGDSEGSFSSAGYFEKYDVLGAFDYLVKQRKIPSEKIAVLGFSMGGATAILASSIEPRIKALAVDSPFADARELIAQETSNATGIPLQLSSLFIPMLKKLASFLYSIDINQMVPEKAARNIKFPILLIHGTSDKRLHFSNSQRIHKNSHKKSKIVLFPKARHSSSYAHDKGSYLKELLAYFRLRLSTRLHSA